jgi:thioesterase domain-containing protein
LSGAPAFLWDKLRDARERGKYDRLFRATCSGENDQAEVPLDFETTYGLLSARYTPRPVRAQIVQCLPQRHIGGGLYAGDRGWSELGYKVDTHTVPGDHREMLTGDNAAVIARHLVARLEAIRLARRAASA